MILILFYAFVAALVCGGAVLGFVLAIYLFRPQRLDEMRDWRLSTGYSWLPSSLITIGLALAALIPAFAGISYAVSDTHWFLLFLGVAGTYFWAWVACAFAFGFLLGLALRQEERR